MKNSCFLHDHLLTYPSDAVYADHYKNLKELFTCEGREFDESSTMPHRDEERLHQNQASVLVSMQQVHSKLLLGLTALVINIID